MIEVNYMTLEDAMSEDRLVGVRNVFLTNLRKYMCADKKFQRIQNISGYGKAWQDYLLEDPEAVQEQLNTAIDAAFSSFTVLRSEYKKLTGMRIFDGGIGQSRKECSESQWDSFRPEKADLLDEVYTFLTLRAEEKRHSK